MENLTKNNSVEMKTVVETFVIEETAELIYDNEKLDKWNKMVEELGLTGQKTIVKQEKSPIPFMHMKPSLKAIFEVLCPAKKDVEQYDITPIPVEILDLVALSKRENYFDKIEIWYDDKSPDPCCVGLIWPTESDRANKYTWTMRPYLIGKWSDVKQSFAELKQRAIERFRLQETAQIQQSIRYQQRQLEDMESTIINKFGTESVLPF